MTRARTISLVAAMALCVVAADATSASAVAPREYSGDSFYVLARQPDPDKKIRIVASLHDLEPGHGYVLVGSSHTCANSGETGGRVFRAQFETAPKSDDLFTRGRVAAHKRLRKMRSVIYFNRKELEPGQELACADRIKPPANGTLARDCGRLDQLLGCVSAAQPAGSNTIGLVGSLHGLQRQQQYALVGSTQPCGQAHAVDDQVFRLNLATAANNDAFGSRTVHADAPLGQAKSVRLLKLPGREQSFCDDLSIAE